MTAAATHAALKALRAGVDAAIAHTGTEALAVFERDGVDRWRTPYGVVSVAVKKDSIQVDGAKFLAWCKVNRPDEVIVTESVRPSYRTAIEARLVIVDDTSEAAAFARPVVVDGRTGEVVEWATVKPGGSAHLMVTGADEPKAVATAMVLEHLSEITAFAAPQIEAAP